MKKCDNALPDISTSGSIRSPPDLHSNCNRCTVHIRQPEWTIKEKFWVLWNSSWEGANKLSKLTLTSRLQCSDHHSLRAPLYIDSTPPWGKTKEGWVTRVGDLKFHLRGPKTGKVTHLTFSVLHSTIKDKACRAATNPNIVMNWKRVTLGDN